MPDPAAALDHLSRTLARGLALPPPDISLAGQLAIAAAAADRTAADHAAERAAYQKRMRRAPAGPRGQGGRARVLAILADGAEHLQADLLAACGVRGGGATDILYRLAAAGRIERRRVAGRQYVRLA